MTKARKDSTHRFQTTLKHTVQVTGKRINTQYTGAIQTLLHFIVEQCGEATAQALAQSVFEKQGFVVSLSQHTPGTPPVQVGSSSSSSSSSSPVATPTRARMSNMGVRTPAPTPNAKLLPRSEARLSVLDTSNMITPSPSPKSSPQTSTFSPNTAPLQVMTFSPNTAPLQATTTLTAGAQ